VIRVADYIVSDLFRLGVRHVFTVSGRGALFLTDALAAHREIRAICTHHEQAAAFAAVAYADASGGLGACLVSTGCAGTNTFTGVLNAWQDAIPCVFISGQNKLKETTHYSGIPIRTFGQQEADLLPMVSSITKYSTMISDPNSVAYEIERAIYFAMEGRRGPVWIDVPLDVQNMRIDPNRLRHFTPPTAASCDPNDSDIDYLIHQLKLAKRPVVLVGSGIRAARAEQELALFVEKNQIPLVYAGSAPDVYGTHHTLSIGSVGTMGCSRAANFAAQNSDFVLVLGHRLSPLTTGTDFEKFARAAKVVVVDIDSVEHQKPGVSIARLVIADVKSTLQALLAVDLPKTPGDWVAKCQHWKSIFPKHEGRVNTSGPIDLYHLADELSKLLPRNATLVTDSGLIELILPTNVGFREGQRAIHPVSQGSMGYALPAAIGVYYATGSPVVAVIGDGSIMMNLQELETIRHNKVPLHILVVNNNAYAVIRKRQRELFGSRTIGTDSTNGVSCPEFKKVAEAFDISYFRIETGRTLNANLQSIFSHDGPILCEVIGLPDQDYVASSFARDENRKIVRRPLEDQSPYLDRELFKAEMIIQPIDQ
jgi:acetolactate synthase-1/2/3 large subunit